VIEHKINKIRPLPDKFTDVPNTSTLFDNAKAIEDRAARELEMIPYFLVIGSCFRILIRGYI
jgi:hypothetical protein